MNVGEVVCGCSAGNYGTTEYRHTVYVVTPSRDVGDEAELKLQMPLTKNYKPPTLNFLIKLIPEPKALYILYTFHYNIILVFFKSFQFACDGRIMQG